MPDETYIINGEHLIAWNCAYGIDRIKTLAPNKTSNKGMIFNSAGPGTAFVQTGNSGFFALGMVSAPENFSNMIILYMKEQAFEERKSKGKSKHRRKGGKSTVLISCQMQINESTKTPLKIPVAPV